MSKTTIFIAILTAAPFLVAGGALWALRRMRAPVLDAPLNPGELWRRILGSSVTPRRVIRLAIILFPFLSLDQIFGIIPRFLVPTAIAIYLVIWLSRTASALEPRSQEVLASIDQISSKLAETRGHLEYLANIVRAKQTEVAAQEEIRKSLEASIAAKQREKGAWEDLTEEQRELLLTQIRQAQKKGATATIMVVIGSIILNLVATLVWTLLGNPGKIEIVQMAQSAWTSMLK